jgi:glucosyltransferase
MKLSIIVPCFNEAQGLKLFFQETIKHLPVSNQDVEFLFVNDGSTDATFEVLKDLKSEHPIYAISVLNFSRNFGKEAGILAGLEHAEGDCVVIMDADLQDPPHLLPQMYKELENEDYDSVATYRVDRKGEPMIRSFFARKFYQLINRISDIQIVDGARDYRMMKRRMVDSILQLKEYHRFSKGIFAWVGYNTKYIEFENVERIAGETKWSFSKLFIYAAEGIVAFTTIPLRMAILLGMAFSTFAFVYMIFVFIKALLFGDPVAGYPSMMVIILLLGGAQLLALGVLGEYLAKTYMEVKQRPKFIIKSKF